MGKIGEPFSKDQLEEIFKDGESRKPQELPPGYKDSKKEKGERPHHFWNGIQIPREYGDLILWHQILEHAKKEETSRHIVFITDDGKEDWWWIVNSRGSKTIGPRPELVNEIMIKSGVSRFYMYNSENFLKYAKQYLKVQISDESVKQVQDIKEAVRNQLVRRPPSIMRRASLEAVAAWIQDLHRNDQIIPSGPVVDLVRVSPETGSRNGYEIKAVRGLPSEKANVSHFLGTVPQVRKAIHLNHVSLVMVLPSRRRAISWGHISSWAQPVPSSSIVAGFLEASGEPSGAGHRFVPTMVLSEGPEVGP